MRVAFDPQAFILQEYGGISRYVCSLVKTLSLYPDVAAKIFAPLYVNAYLPDLPLELVSGLKIPRIPKTEWLLNAASQILVWPAMSLFRPDIVHETYYSPCAYAPSAARRVVTVHDMIHERFSRMFLKRGLTSARKRIATQRADHVICVSENTRRDLLELFNLPKDKVSVVYHGFKCLTLDTSVVDIQSKPYLLYVGQRSGYKNFEFFLRAYASSPWLCNNFKVVCFGGGAFSSNEIKQFRDLRLSDTQLEQRSGSDTKLAGCYRNAAAFVYPSLYEGFGIPPLEAMSMGCPVVCSDTSSIPEVVGSAAEYFDPQVTESIRAAMERVLNSSERRDELIRHGQLRCTQFSWERCSNETLAIYKGLM